METRYDVYAPASWWFWRGDLTLIMMLWNHFIQTFLGYYLSHSHLCFDFCWQSMGTVEHLKSLVLTHFDSIGKAAHNHNVQCSCATVLWVCTLFLPSARMRSEGCSTWTSQYANLHRLTSTGSALCVYLGSTRSHNGGRVSTLVCYLPPGRGVNLQNLWWQKHGARDNLGATPNCKVQLPTHYRLRGGLLF